MRVSRFGWNWRMRSSGKLMKGTLSPFPAEAGHSSRQTWRRNVYVAAVGGRRAGSAARRAGGKHGRGGRSILVSRVRFRVIANRLVLPPAGFDDLPVEDQIDYVQSLWDRIAAKPDQAPVPDWHKRVLEQRLAAHEAHPDAARRWEEVRDAIRSRLERGSDH